MSVVARRCVLRRLAESFVIVGTFGRSDLEIPRRPLTPSTCHRSNKIADMPCLLVEKMGVARRDPERPQERWLAPNGYQEPS
jgi:hypothetical protein